MTPEERASIIDDAFGQPIYSDRLRFAVAQQIRAAIIEEHDRIIAVLNKIKSDMGDLESVNGYGVRESIDELIESIQD